MSSPDLHDPEDVDTDELFSDEQGLLRLENRACESLLLFWGGWGGGGGGF